MEKYRKVAAALFEKALVSPAHVLLLAPMIDNVSSWLEQEREQESLAALWSLLERMDRIGCLLPEEFRDLRGKIRRLEFRPLKGDRTSKVVTRRTGWDFPVRGRERYRLKPAPDVS